MIPWDRDNCQAQICHGLKSEMGTDPVDSCVEQCNAIGDHRLTNSSWSPQQCECLSTSFVLHIMCRVLYLKAVGFTYLGIQCG